MVKIPPGSDIRGLIDGKMVVVFEKIIPTEQVSDDDIFGIYYENFFSKLFPG